MLLFVPQPRPVAGLQVKGKLRESSGDLVFVVVFFLFECKCHKTRLSFPRISVGEFAVNWAYVRASATKLPSRLTHLQVSLSARLLLVRWPVCGLTERPVGGRLLRPFFFERIAARAAS